MFRPKTVIFFGKNKISINFFRLGKLKEEGVLKKERMDSLLNKKWNNYSVILHEAREFDKTYSTLQNLSELPQKVLAFLKLSFF